ncbi:protein JOKA2 isoform X2 [Tripterygium wilfordii]|uniref:protein JOKA2 isoform X2 n=1 Tax=Tripterygium wilfordii TaxID=458696 RepID=UPI0018F83223|nr:protein JOKA2 isoform X2 [Tripterygium wilfordii]
MEYAMVIKVKYGDTLRRFSVPVNEKKQLDLDMGRLKGKILSLFNFPLDADLILTYIDEDGDVVTLADDNDLCDVMSQRLKFLRIDVQLNDEKSGNSSASSGSATLVGSPQIQKPLPNISVGNEVLKLIPNPLYETLSKLSLDLASKATSSSPVLAELLECFSKMSHGHLNPVSQSGPDTSTEGGSSAGLKAPLVSNDANASKDYGSQEELRKSNLATEQIKKVKIENVARGVGVPNLSEATPVNLNVNPPINAPANDDTGVHKEIDGHLSGESVDFGLSDMAGSTRPASVVRGQNSEFIGNITNGCPFSGMTKNNHAAVPPRVHPRVSPFKRSNNRYDAAVGMFHKGVRCDGCGVHPITGPRFKSNLKEDYDLCSICFSEMGNVSDYIRIDRPQSYRHPQAVQGLHDFHHRVSPHKVRQFLRSVSVKSARPKLDSCFVSDVNVLDGTVMAPSTSFTKIWRMRNCGDSVWPQGSQLVWIGGDRLSMAISVNIPADGVPIDGELDIAVDFISPPLPGRYISYWRMATPSGVKFGQRVWVLIQVDAALKDAFCERFQDLNLNVTLQDEVDGYQGLNLNYPPVGGCSKFPEMLDMNVLPVGDDVSSLPSGSAVLEPAKPVAVEQPKEENAESNFPINDALLVGSGASAPPAPLQVPSEVNSHVSSGASAPRAPLQVPSEVNSRVSYPIIDLSETTAAGISYPTPSFSEAPISSEGAKEIDEVEKSLLKELEMMGFKQVELNKVILRRNEYNLEQSLDDLCGDAEWDTILEELQEMGFCNQESNKRLLKKNNGSIKRVVMELLSGEEV